MTRKDFQLIADTVKEARSDAVAGEDHADWIASATLDALVRKLAKRLKNENPRFDKARFINACEFDGG